MPDRPLGSDSYPCAPTYRKLQVARSKSDLREEWNTARSELVVDETRRSCRNYLINKGLRPVGGGDYYRRPGHAILHGFPGHVMIVDALMRICQAPTGNFFHDLTACCKGPAARQTHRIDIQGRPATPLLTLVQQVPRLARRHPVADSLLEASHVGDRVGFGFGQARMKVFPGLGASNLAHRSVSVHVDATPPGSRSFLGEN